MNPSRGDPIYCDVEQGRAKVQWCYVDSDGNIDWCDGFPPRIGKPGRRVMLRYVWLDDANTNMRESTAELADQVIERLRAINADLLEECDQWKAAEAELSAKWNNTLCDLHEVRAINADLLEALKDMLNTWETDTHNQYKIHVDKARAAIAKAIDV